MNPHELFSSCLAPDEILNDPEKIRPLTIDDRGRFFGHADIVLRPKSVASVQTVMRLCREHRIAVTPQGGNTSLCGAATPYGGVLLLLSRLNRVRALSREDMAITVEAGAILADVQKAADDAGLFFPLSLAAEGSCQIGGNIACNAGGINVVRYGTARDLVLGLETVLPDGSLISRLAPVHKNTTGLDLRHFFIGSEGTLGIITAATLKLFRKPEPTSTLWVSCPSVRACVELLRCLREIAGERIKSFELMSEVALGVVVRDLKTQSPTGKLSGWHVLCEWESADDRDGECEKLARSLHELGFDDALIAQNESQRRAWWHLRETIPAAQRRRGVSLKHDIAAPIAAIADIVEKCERKVHDAFPAADIVLFGHLGDGSLHYNVFLTDHPDASTYEHEAEMNRIVYDVTLAHGGTVAAEHGIGILKRKWMKHIHSPEELNLMLAVKRRADPLGIMNPGKVWP